MRKNGSRIFVSILKSSSQIVIKIQKRIQTKISFDVRSGVNKNFTVKYVHPGTSSCGYWLKILEILRHGEWLIH